MGGAVFAALQLDFAPWGIGNIDNFGFTIETGFLAD
jgi:hypothetical protein